MISLPLQFLKTAELISPTAESEHITSAFLVELQNEWHQRENLYSRDMKNAMYMRISVMLSLCYAKKVLRTKGEAKCLAQLNYFFSGVKYAKKPMTAKFIR
jgi:hypothetical protein